MLSQTAQLLDQANRIFIYALGDSQIRAKSFQNKLVKINKYVVIATELSEWAYHTANLTSEDCAIFLTYHGKSPIFLKAARHFTRENIPLSPLQLPIKVSWPNEVVYVSRCLMTK